uniref:Sema domain-containing protein n=1 Tax=Periophthalmus magnuspinnatus TaxID=409849 RepID=A0A3B3ZPN2_9GOBI
VDSSQGLRSKNNPEATKGEPRYSEGPLYSVMCERWGLRGTVLAALLVPVHISRSSINNAMCNSIQMKMYYELVFVVFQMECQNYIRVLLVNKTEVMTCGTNAFQPLCTTREVGNMSRVLERVNGVARCPYDPRHNSTAVVTESGELYAATVIDFSGRDPVIYRSLGHLPPLRTAQYNSKWLNEPHFISAYDIGLFTFFFLRENAVEHDCGKTVYSRVARVCKNDIGGRFLLEDTWTTFMKARLNCSRSGEIPFYYNELQSTFYLPEQDLIYGIFTTNVNSIAASAVCAFNLSAITQAFNGPFRSQENPRSTWLPTPNPIHNFQCGTISERGPNEGLTERSLQDAQRLYLMNDVVQPETTDPLVMQDDVRFSSLVVDIVQVIPFNLSSHGPHKMTWRAAFGPRTLTLTHVH